MASNKTMNQHDDPSPVQPFTFSGRVRSIAYALRGFRLMLVSQHNAWIHALLTIVVAVAGFASGVSRIEWCVLVLAMVAVWTAEALNTALEFLCDVASPQFHPLVEKAKDVAAAGVLLSAIGSLIIAILIFSPYVAAM